MTLETPGVNYRDQSSNVVFPPILYLETVLGLGIIVGVAGIILHTMARLDPNFGGDAHKVIEWSSLLIGLGAPMFAANSKLLVDAFAAKGPWMDLGDGIVRNAKSLDPVDPVRSRIRGKLRREDIEALSPDVVKKKNLKEGDYVRCESWWLPIHYGGHEFAAMGTDGLCWHLMHAWISTEDGFVLFGERPSFKVGQKHPLPGTFSANGKLCHAGLTVWDVEWYWDAERVDSEGRVIEAGKYVSGLPTNLIDYMAMNGYCQDAGATPAHAKRYSGLLFNSVPKLYRKGWVKVSYGPSARAVSSSDAAAEVRYMQGLQIGNNLFGGEKISDMAALSRVASAAGNAAKSIVHADSGGGGGDGRT